MVVVASMTLVVVVGVVAVTDGGGCVNDAGDGGGEVCSEVVNMIGKYW